MQIFITRYHHLSLKRVMYIYLVFNCPLNSKTVYHFQGHVTTWSEIASPRKYANRSVSECSDSRQPDWPELSCSTSSISESQPSDPNSRCSSRTTSECHSEPHTEQSDLIDILVEMFPNLSMASIERSLTKTNNDLELAVVQLLEEETPDFKIVSKSRTTEKESNGPVITRQTSAKKGSKKSRKKGSRSNSQSQAEVENDEMLSANDLKSLIIDKLVKPIVFLLYISFVPL